MKVIKDSIIYLTTSSVNKLIPFLLLPIMTEYLLPEEYGLLSVYMLFITLFSAFIGMNLHLNISKNFFQVSKEKMAIIIGNIFILLFISFGVYFLAVLLFASESVFSIPFKWFLLIPVISFFMMINVINKTILRNEGKALLFGGFEISHSLINAGITLMFLIIYGLGWYAQVYGLVVSYFAFFIVGLVYIKQNNYIVLEYDKVVFRKLLKISLPLIPHALGGAILTMSDRIFIEKMINLETVGIYSVGYTFGMIVLLFSNSFIKAWNPWFYKKLASPSHNNKKLIVKYSYLYIIGILGIAIFVGLFGNYILPYFVDEAYYSAASYIFWIAIGYAMFGMYQIFFPYLVHIEKTSFLAISTTIAAALNLLLNYICINSFGAIGAAYATFLSYLVMFLLVSIYTQRHFKMPWFYMFK
jgi:O-antigen/teichoic acid export membrane protein